MSYTPQVRNLRRALRLLENNPVLRASAPSQREMALIQQRMDRKIEITNEFHALWSVCSINARLCCQ
jgi:hypothetical protein